MEKKFMLSCIFFLVSESFIASLHAGSGGEAAVGGFAGSMVGGLMSGAMTRGGSSDDGGRRSASKVMRELNKLEDAVAHDLRKLDERIGALAKEVNQLKDRGENADVDALKKDVKEVKGSVKELKKSIDDRFEELDDRFAAIEKSVKRLENKSKTADSDKEISQEKDIKTDPN